MAFNLRTLVGTVAPTLASMLGGPLAGSAVRALSELVLGKADGTEEEVVQQLQAADPATLLKLKELDKQFTTQMRQLDVDLERIAAEDRGSARSREMALRDHAPVLLAMLTFCGFFGILAALIFLEIPASGREPLSIMLGTLGSMIVAVSQYYFGSSLGSTQKTQLLGEAMRNGK